MNYILFMFGGEIVTNTTLLISGKAGQYLVFMPFVKDPGKFINTVQVNSSSIQSVAISKSTGGVADFGYQEVPPLPEGELITALNCLTNIQCDICTSTDGCGWCHTTQLCTSIPYPGTQDSCSDRRDNSTCFGSNNGILPAGGTAGVVIGAFFAGLFIGLIVMAIIFLIINCKDKISSPLKSEQV